MGRCYSHLTIEDRCDLARRHASDIRELGTTLREGRAAP